MTGTFSVTGYTRFQHYKDRNPPWIKLYNSTLEDYAFGELPDASKAHLFAIWLLASRYENKIPYDADWVARRINATEPVDLDILVAAGFLIINEDCSDTIASRKRIARPEREGETQVETEKEGEKARSADADDTAAIQAYNSVASELNWPQAQILTPKRRAGLHKRLEECGGLQGWMAAMTRARASPFLRGETGRDAEHEKWVPDLDFFLQQSSFTKLMEGKYDDRTKPRGASGIGAVAAGIAASVDGQRAA